MHTELNEAERAMLQVTEATHYQAHDGSIFHTAAGADSHNRKALLWSRLEKSRQYDPDAWNNSAMGEPDSGGYAVWAEDLPQFIADNEQVILKILNIKLD